MDRVTGIGGVFFKAKDPKVLRDWYRRHLGIDVEDWGGTAFHWAGGETTIWSIGAADSDSAPFTINYRVADVRALLETLREEGCAVVDDYSESDYGKFGWVVDPEGNKVELWEPPPGQ